MRFILRVTEYRAKNEFRKPLVTNGQNFETSGSRDKSYFVLSYFIWYHTMAVRPAYLFFCLLLFWGRMEILKGQTGESSTLLSRKITPQTDTTLLEGLREVPAESPEPLSARHLSWGHLSNGQGLSDRAIWSVAQDKKGFIWFGTRGAGLLRYDGNKFLIISTLEGLPSNSVRDLTVRENGDLWIATDRGLAMIQDNYLITFRFPDEAQPTFNKFLHDPDGTLWATGWGQFVNWKDKTMTVYQSHTPAAGICDAGIDEDGRIWVTGLDSCVYVSGQGQFRERKIPEADPKDFCLNIHNSPSGEIWLSYGTYALEKRGDTFIRLTHPAGIEAGARIWNMAFPAGKEPLFFLIGQGVFRKTGTHFTPVEVPEPFQGRWVTDYLADRSGAQWYTTFGAGVFRHRVQPLRFIKDKSNELLYVAHLRTSSGGEVIGGGGGGNTELFALKNGQAKAFRKTPDDFFVLSLDAFSREEFVLGSHSQGYFIFSGGDSAHYVGPLPHPEEMAPLKSSRNPGSKGYVHSVHAAPSGRIWVNFSGDLHGWENGKLAIVYTDSGGCGKYPGIPCSAQLPPQVFYPILEDRKQRVWAGTENGLFLFEGESVKQVNLEPIGIPPSVHALAEDGEGNIWVACRQQGLYAISDDTTYHFPPVQGFPASRIVAIHADAEGELWLAGPQSILKMENPGPHPIFRKFNVFGGLPDIGFSGRDVGRDAAGNLYWGTNRGILFQEKDGLHPASKPPLVFLESATLTRKNHSPASENPTRHQALKESSSFENIQYPPGYYEANFEFTGLDWPSPAELRFQYRLVGFDSTWSRPQRERFAHFLQVPPGTYAFEVRAVSGAGVISQPVRFPFTIRTPFQSSWWFFILVGMGLAGATVLLFRWRSQNASRRQRMLEELVAAQTQDLQTALGEKEAMLQEIHHRVKNNLQLISSLLQLQGGKSENAEVAGIISEGQRKVETISMIHQILYQRKSFGSVDMAEYVRELCGSLENLFFTRDKKITLSQQVNVGAFDLDTAIPLGLILNELVTNAFKHAFHGMAEGNIHIALEKEQNGHFYLLVEDNGQGLPPDFDLETSEGLGLHLVKILAHQMDGKLTWQRGKRTLFRLNFKDTSTRKLTE